MYVVDIDLSEYEEPKKKISLIDEIKNLSSIPTNPGDKEVIFKSISKKNKKKNKKKKKKHSEGIKEILDIIPVEESEPEEENLDFVDVDELLHRGLHKEDDIAAEIIGTQSRNYKKLKKDENPFKKEFAEELTLLYNLLNEADKNNKMLEKQYKEMTTSKTRGVSKYSTDLAATIQQATSTRLHIIKEIVATKKTMADLKIKVDAKSKDSESASNQDTLASAYLNKIMGVGRTEFINATKNNVSEQLESIGWDTSDDNTIYRDQINDIISERVDESGLYTDTEGDKYIQYEHLDVRQVIKRNLDTGDWEMIALDKHEQQIFDYPVPDKDDLTPVKFTDDGSYATDKFGRSYPVIECV